MCKHLAPSLSNQSVLQPQHVDSEQLACFMPMLQLCTCFVAGCNNVYLSTVRTAANTQQYIYLLVIKLARTVGIVACVYLCIPCTICTEAGSGITFSDNINMAILCLQLDSKCNILNDQMFRSNSSAEYIARASKVVTLVDLAGHERYFKTTAYGLTGHMPDYACLIVGANAGRSDFCPSSTAYSFTAWCLMPNAYCCGIPSSCILVPHKLKRCPVAAGGS